MRCRLVFDSESVRAMTFGAGTRFFQKANCQRRRLWKWSGSWISFLASPVEIRHADLGAAFAGSALHASTKKLANHSTRVGIPELAPCLSKTDASQADRMPQCGWSVTPWTLINSPLETIY